MVALILALVLSDPGTLEGKVVSVLDGDTIKILADNRQVTIRLAGIDAPEKRQPFGQAAKSRLSDLVFGKSVSVETHGRDRYGRTIGVVTVDGINANRQMVSEGLAWHYKRFSHDCELAISEHDAREFRRGLWAESGPIQPWEWRAARKSPEK